MKRVASLFFALLLHLLSASCSTFSHILLVIRSSHCNTCILELHTIMSTSNLSTDVEKDAANSNHAHLTNDSVHTFSWENVTVTVTDRSSKQPLDILSNVSGMVETGELIALMGPR